MPERSASASGSTVRVRVVGDPGGDPPQWVRDAWLGVEFDATRIDGPVGMGSARNRKRWRRRLEGGWVVPANDAVSALVAFGRDDAAAWWAGKGWSEQATLLVFGLAACEPVE